MTTERSDRLNPIARSDYLAQQHLLRYLFAGDQLSDGLKVLDIACGTGFGTHVLHQYGIEAIGADIDRSQLQLARNMWQASEFEYADVLDMPFEDASFDAVISFETIEHVTFEAKDRFLDEVERVLRPNGIFIASTPNIRYTVHPLYHLYEYRPAEYYELIESRFADVQRHAQYFEPGDRLNDLMKRKVFRYTNAIGRRLGLSKQKSVENDQKEDAETMSLAQLTAALNPASNPYQVRGYTGDNLLRIMVTVGYKST